MQLDGSYPTVTNELALCVKLEPVTVICVFVAPDVGLLVIEADGAEAWKELPASVIVPGTSPKPLTWAQMVYVPAATDGGQLNVPVKLLPVTVRFEALPTEVNGLQPELGPYPRVTDTVDELRAVVMLEPFTVIGVFVPPVPGVLVIEGA